jgi:hypothetical protein
MGKWADSGGNSERRAAGQIQKKPRMNPGPTTAFFRRRRPEQDQATMPADSSLIRSAQIAGSSSPTRRQSGAVNNFELSRGAAQYLHNEAWP